MRKPLHVLLQRQNGTTANDGIVNSRDSRCPLVTHLSLLTLIEWTLVWEHVLAGPITKVSGPPSTNRSSLQFAVLYHTVDDESTRYYVRVYYLVKELGSFEYKDLVLPGTTWIKSFALETNRIIFSR